MSSRGKFESRLPAPLRNRGTAVVITVLMSVLAVVVFGGGQLQDKVQAAEETFYEKGGISDSINLRAEAASNLVTVAARIPDADADKELKDLNKALEKLEKANGPEEESLADRAVEDAKIALVEALLEPSKNADQQVQKLLTGQSAEFDSAGGRISAAAKDYNKQADEVNEILHRFPANIFRLLRGVGEVEYCK